ncbi:MAG TPA: LytTR family DNA-binding domain-containing protein, partial [Verrucomicrobiae bacterium]
NESDIEIVGEASNCAEAADAIARLNPELLFLDIRMPGADGFDLLEAIGRANPLVIFVTASDEHAVRAFDVDAIDYVLKPVEFDRFRTALSRAREAFQKRRATMTPGNRLALRDAGKTLFLDPDQIDWAESEGNYVRLHIGKKSFLWRATLNDAEKRLAAHHLLRISRSTLVNVDRITEWQPLLHGDSTVILRDGARLTVTRLFRSNLNDWVRQLA